MVEGFRHAGAGDGWRPAALLEPEANSLDFDHLADGQVGQPTWCREADWSHTPQRIGGHRV